MLTTDILNILFLDIETVPLEFSFFHLDEKSRAMWAEKSTYFQKEGESVEKSYQRAGIYAEFGKVICISLGKIVVKEGAYQFKMRSFYGHDEAQLLNDFANLLHKQPSHINLCAHNGKEFDFPYLSRRMLIHSIVLPARLNIAGKKPWETSFIDTMELWKFGDYKHYTSLKLLAHVLGVPGPKDDIDGSMVANVYWMEKDLERIKKYCEKDVLTLARIFLKMKEYHAIELNDVIYL